jgi:hypothetical protein
MMLQPTARKQGHKGNRKLRRETFSGRLDRTNNARAIKYPMYKYAKMIRGEDMDNIILSLVQRQKEKKVGLNTKLWGQTKMQYKLLQQKRMGR